MSRDGRPVVTDLRASAQRHVSESKAADQHVREGSRPLLSIVSGLLQKEGTRLNEEKQALDNLAVSLAAEAKTVQAEYEDISAALEMNSEAVSALFARERDLHVAAVAATKQAEETGLETDREAAKAARHELETFRQGLAGALTKLGDEKSEILARRDKNGAAREQLQKTAAAALARYKNFESQQAGHDADELMIRGIKF